MPVLRPICQTLLMSAATCALAACGPQVLPPSGPHAVTDPDRILLYQQEPSKYELLGEIAMPVTPDMRFDEHGDSTVGFEALKARAAAMGANGVLLLDKSNKHDYLVGVGYRGMYYQVPMRADPKSVVANAIYVPQE
jgi:hypothetical protein